MSTKKLRYLIMALFVTLILAGCQPCDDTGHNTFVIFPDLPADDSIISSLIPVFEWHDDSSCTPDNFQILVKGKWNSYIEDTKVPGAQSAYSWHESLDPGSQYKWRIRTFAENYVTGQFTDYLTFYTGPVCSGEALDPPESGSLYAGWITHDHLQEFSWDYSGSCLPPFYDYEFATDAAFTNVVDSGTTPDHKMFVEKTFPNCSTIFWRVRANDGTSTGPWSDPSSFHWVRNGTDCYQTHYLSDEFAWINVRLGRDHCAQTGFVAAWTPAPLDPGCMVEGMIIVGDGTSYSSNMSDFTVDLGSGPCPSTGLDQKTPDGWEAKFGVVTPGTYCVTISRNQTVDNNGPISLMDGIWTDPRSNQILVEETIDFGPGNHDFSRTFVWDEIERNFLTYPLDFTYACKIGPEKVCPTYDFAMEGDAIPILGRDTKSDWKLTQLNGTPCYILLSDLYINKKLNKYEGSGWQAEDIDLFPEPDPCPRPESDPRQKTCSDYATRSECGAHITDGCLWDPGIDGCVGP